MRELIERFIENGLTEEQAKATITTLHNWLEDHYPVAGVLVSTWAKKENPS